MLDSLLWEQSRFHLNGLTMKILGWQSWIFIGVIFLIGLFFESLLASRTWSWVEARAQRKGKLLGWLAVISHGHLTGYPCLGGRQLLRAGDQCRPAIARLQRHHGQEKTHPLGVGRSSEKPRAGGGPPAITGTRFSRGPRAGLPPQCLAMRAGQRPEYPADHGRCHAQRHVQ